MVLSVSESGFALRAFGVWKRYAVEGTIEPAEFGTRVILEVNPTERAPALQAVAAGLLALTLVSLLGIGMPYWTYFRAGDPLVWSSLATGLALLAALSIAAFDTPRMSNRALMALSRRLQAFLHAKAAS